MYTSSFAEHVREAVRQIPKGETRTYGEVARAVGHPGAARAVGTVMKNNYDPTVPCHRVVRSDLPAPRPDIFYVYVILCKNDAMYIGQTDNLQRRFSEHRAGTAAEYTKKYGVKKLIHYEKFKTRDEAIQREGDLKTGFGRKWLKREWEAGRTRQAGGKLGAYNRGGEERKLELLCAEGAI